jgi:hypothetical protein
VLCLLPPGCRRLARSRTRTAMTLGERLVSVWQQTLVEERRTIELDGQSYSVRETRSRRLRTVEFEYGERRIAGIEQNPATASKWAAMAREGQRVMQFSCGGRYFANVAEGKLLRYSAWAALEFPD